MSINGIDSQQSYVAQAQQSPSKPPSSEDMFKKLSQDVGGDGKNITKDQLESYIKELESSYNSSKDKGEWGFLKQLDSNWDKISGGNDSITADNLKSNMDLLRPPKGQGGPPQGERHDWQDPSTISSDQLEPPIDIRV